MTPLEQLKAMADLWAEDAAFDRQWGHLFRPWTFEDWTRQLMVMHADPGSYTPAELAQVEATVRATILEMPALDLAGLVSAAIHSLRTEKEPLHA